MLLTATPFTNSPLEIYSMLSLVAYDSMRRNGIYHINAFFDTFVLPTVEWTANYKEEIVEKLAEGEEKVEDAAISAVDTLHTKTEELKKAVLNK